MTTASFRARTLACALLAGTAICALTAAPAYAQNAQPHRAVDANGVDLTHGDFLMEFIEGSIGSGEGELALVRNGVWIIGRTSDHQWDRITFEKMPLSGGGTRYIVRLGARQELFDGTGTLPTGSTLSGSGGSFTYRTADGTEIDFGDPAGSTDSNSPHCNGTQTSCALLPLSVTSPNGKTVTVAWDIWNECTGEIEYGTLSCTYHARIASVSNSFGYQIRFAYAAIGQGGETPPPQNWFKRTGATFHNSTVSGSPAQASVSYAYPSTGVTEVTDTGGRVWRFTGSSNRVTGIRRPGASSDTTSVSYTTGHIVTSVTREGVTTNYARSVSGNTATMTVTNALSQQSTIVSDMTIGRPTSVTDALSRTTGFQYDTSGRLTRVTAAEGNYTQYTYDARGNVTQTQAVPKSGSGLATLTTSASFDATCSNPVTCNQPNSTTDARGNVTDYTYDSTHGGVLTITAPAPSSGAVRPQTRYAYTLANGEYQLTGISQCQTTTSCANGADEVKTTFVYDANGNVTSTSSGNGSATLTATAAMTYDPLGNLLTVDGPLVSTADTTRYRYNAARQLIGTISPDPDGGGSLKHRAVRNSYTNGLLTKVEQGTVNSQSDGDWASFSSLEEVQTSYDANARPIVQKLVSGGTTYALTQASYDALALTECVAQRMNSGVFSSLPSSACSLGTQGSFGPDRIAKMTYDAAGQVTKTISGYGTSDQADDVTTTYTSNGLVQTLTDAENNKTTFVYDGHDRLSQQQFPSTTKGAGTSNSSDYEQLSYDANGNVVSRRLRDGNSIGFTFDTLNRLTAKDLFGSEPDVSYSYDLLGRMTAASQSGHSLSFTYDALSRKLTEAGPHGTVTSAWDVAGRRSRITHPDAFYVDQDYLVTGELTNIRENGATSGIGVLATFAYDDLGRRTSLTRGNGTSTSYSYDAVSRLAQLVDNPTGSTHDQTLTFSYDPASAISSTTRSNDLFAWSGHGSGTTTSVANGLNQLTVIGGTSTSHDARGNMTADGLGKTFGYSSENLLTSASGGVGLSYDPGMRLYQVAGAATTRLGYDGVDLIAEYNGSNSLQRRFVHGSGLNEPLVSYEGSGTSDRRFLHADERGSVIGVSDNAGNAIAVNRYDEYGKPQAVNLGRYQYTGQTWLTEIGLYYYKTRMYHPTLGRFMQTDPIGYGDGANLYAYVRNDPINFTDPLGLCRIGEVPLPIPRTKRGAGDVVAYYRYICLPLPLGFGINDVNGGDGGSDVGAGAVSGDAPPPQPPIHEPGNAQRTCKLRTPNFTAGIDVGVFIGYGGGASFGIHWDTNTGVISAFRSARVGTGMGWSIGGGVGLTSGPLDRGMTSTYNRSISIGSVGGGYSYSQGGGALSTNISRGLLGPQIGAEWSKTQNLTESVKLTEGGDMLCQVNYPK